MSIEAILAKSAAWIPFIMAVDNGKSFQLNTNRMIEAVIIGGAIALVGYLTVIPKLEERLENIANRLNPLSAHVNEPGHPTLLERLDAERRARGDLERRVMRLEKIHDRDTGVAP